MENSVKFPLKTKNRTTIWFRNLWHFCAGYNLKAKLQGMTFIVLHVQRGAGRPFQPQWQVDFTLASQAALRKGPGSLYFHTFSHITYCSKNYLSSLPSLPQVPQNLACLPRLGWGSLLRIAGYTPEFGDYSLRAAPEILFPQFCCGPIEGSFFT